ncbi:DNA-binding transcriptional LysR family regulator [Maritalea mobilis]|uniref:DNA-binding transcriptional LysR family regulator n=1 Tax=Maritalea mobilis TaxID=483324 RepID=A0A4R6VMY6_9HYPH|nr:LysR substrate-binding domain-containing protein [Maritalea mobilis]TDQ64447.1 DNA-binding transcriptional LysR family regulator [Maritalea mobilis]
MEYKEKMRRTLPSMNSLVCFEAVYRLGSITLAAEELNMTQSAVSRRIQVLESQLGQSLFRRERKRLFLEPAAENYGKDMSQILSEIEASTARFLSHNQSIGLLTVAVPPTFGSRWLVPKLNNFITEHPGLDLNLVSKIRPFNFDQEDIDMAIHFGNPEWPGAKLQFLMPEHVIPVCSPTLIGQTQPKSIADILDFPLVHHTTRPTLWQTWCQYFELPTNKIKSGPRFEHYAHVIQAAVNGIGFALIPDFLVRNEILRGDLIVPVQGRMKCEEAYYFTWPNKRRGDRRIETFSKWIKGQCALAE